jgi:hypothetical protein
MDPDGVTAKGKNTIKLVKQLEFYVREKRNGK